MQSKLTTTTLRITSLANVVKVEDSIKTYVNRWIFHQNDVNQITTQPVATVLHDRSNLFTFAGQLGQIQAATCLELGGEIHETCPIPAPKKGNDDMEGTYE